MKVAALSGVEPPLYGGALVRAVVVLPVKVLSRVFREKFLAGLKCLYRGKKLQLCRPVHRAGRSPAVRSTDSPPAPSGLGSL